MRRTAGYIPAAALLLLLAAPTGAHAASLTRELAEALRAAGPDAELAVIARLAERVDAASFTGSEERSLRRARVVRALRDKALRTQAPVLGLLRSAGASAVRPLWIDNSVAFRARADVVRALAARDDVASIGLDATFAMPGALEATPASPEWNLGAIRAPELWALGHAGGGVVVAALDTGVDAFHPDLATRWRGGTNSWFDPYAGGTFPAIPSATAPR